ncbi:hypothetical protein FH972_022040 [Carpinus fangiana]|uniref:ABC1 atypical kinase-like domain-containing protein n=1 Tax=Carpinus fangiana TaxID=176857 RepID=A0A5N6KRQ4_9ROSI|nr:hypothetical protein FH972_022040 [Carpinus fangiana]
MSASSVFLVGISCRQCLRLARPQPTFSSFVHEPSAFAARILSRSSHTIQGLSTSARASRQSNHTFPFSRRPSNSGGRYHFSKLWLLRAPPKPRYGRKILFSGTALTPAAFVLLSEQRRDGDEDRTGEDIMLQASRKEIESQVPSFVGSSHGVRYTAWYYFDTYIFEPVATGFRFLHLLILFVPVIVVVPAIWFGRRIPEKDNERAGSIWWYRFLVASMERAGAAFIKLGQWAASRSDIFPKQMCAIMGSLHSNAPAHSLRKTKAIIEKAFDGRPFEEIFEEFQEEPLGVGAIAQVYKAKLQPHLAVSSDNDLEETTSLTKRVRRNVDALAKSTPRRVPSSYVAIKVLHPDAERIVRRDLRIMGFFANIINAIPTMEWLSFPDEVAQFGEMMQLQLDLRIEAANLTRFRKNFKDRTTAWFPFPYSDYTTREVLIEEFANGIPLEDFLANGGGIYQKEIANEGLDAFLRMLLIDNFIHADLHPGNIMVRFYEPQKIEVPATTELFSRTSTALQGPNVQIPGTEKSTQEPTDSPDPSTSDDIPKAPTNDVTELVLSRLRPHRHDPTSWRAELAAIDSEGYRPQLIFIDTGLVTELNSMNRNNFLDLFKAVAEFDGYRAGHLMVERCRQPDAVIDKEVFALRMQHLVLGVKSRTFSLGNIKIGDILSEVLDMVRGHHVRLEGDFVNVVLSILLLEGIGRSLDPEMDLFAGALPILRQLGAQGGTGMLRKGDFSMIKVWAGLEARRLITATVEETPLVASPKNSEVLGYDVHNFKTCRAVCRAGEVGAEGVASRGVAFWRADATDAAARTWSGSLAGWLKLSSSDGSLDGGGVSDAACWMGIFAAEARFRFDERVLKLAGCAGSAASTDGTNIGKSAKRIRCDEARSRAEVSIVGAGLQAVVCDKFILDELDADQLSDLEQIIALAGNAEEECNWVANVAQNEGERERRVVDIQVATPPAKQTVDESDETDDAKECRHDHACNLETQPATVGKGVESVGSLVLVIIRNDDAARSHQHGACDSCEARSHDLVQFGNGQMSHKGLDEHRRLALADEWGGSGDNSLGATDAHRPEEENGCLLDEPLQSTPVEEHRDEGYEEDNCRQNGEEEEFLGGNVGRGQESDTILCKTEQLTSKCGDEVENIITSFGAQDEQCNDELYQHADDDGVPNDKFSVFGRSPQHEDEDDQTEQAHGPVCTSVVRSLLGCEGADEDDCNDQERAGRDAQLFGNESHDFWAEGEQAYRDGEPQQERDEPILVVAMQDQAGDPPACEQQEDKKVEEDAPFSIQVSKAMALRVGLGLHRATIGSCSLALLGVVHGVGGLVGSSMLLRVAATVQIVVLRRRIRNCTVVEGCALRVHHVVLVAVRASGGKGAVVEVRVGMFVRTVERGVVVHGDVRLRRGIVGLRHCG